MVLVWSLEEEARGRARAKKGGSELPHSKVLRTARAPGEGKCRRFFRARFARLGVR